MVPHSKFSGMLTSLPFDAGAREVPAAVLRGILARVSSMGHQSACEARSTHKVLPIARDIFFVHGKVLATRPATGLAEGLSRLQHRGESYPAQAAGWGKTSPRCARLASRKLTCSWPWAPATWGSSFGTVRLV